MDRIICCLVMAGSLCATRSAAGVDVHEFKSEAAPRFDVSDANRELWKDRAHDLLLSPQISEGPKVVLYSGGVGSLDSWYPTPGDGSLMPPQEERYHEFTYVDGLLVTVHCIDQGRRELVYRLWHEKHDSRGPSLCTLYVGGREAYYYLASYDSAGLISEVVTLNGDFAPVWISVHENLGIYDACMITTYGQANDFAINHRTFFDGEGVWLESDIQEWKRVNIRSRRASLNSLQKFGIKPHYPITTADEGAAAAK